MLKSSKKNLEKEKLEWTVSVLQEHFHYYQIQVNELNRENDELERYGRRLCVRIEGIPLVGNETFNEVFDKVMSIMQEDEYDISEVVIYRTQRIGYLEKTLKNYVKVSELGFQHLNIELSSTGAEVS